MIYLLKLIAWLFTYLIYSVTMISHFFSFKIYNNIKYKAYNNKFYLTWGQLSYIIIAITVYWSEFNIIMRYIIMCLNICATSY